jgi:hypothetical protein
MADLLLPWLMGAGAPAIVIAGYWLIAKLPAA